MTYDSVSKIRNADWNYGGSKWRLSRSKIDLFMECPRCFYLDNKLGVSRPKMPSFTLNVAVDELLKKEFDIHRKNRNPHPLMDKYGVDAVPYQHKDIDVWRHNFSGIEYNDSENDLLISGAIDDVWVDKKGELIIVDYKATSKKEGPDKEEDLYDSYKRQMEIYQWLFRKNNFSVSSTGYFVYVNGKSDAESFDGKLEFDVNLIPYTGDTSWIEKTIIEIKKTLTSDEIPAIGKAFSGGPCDYCSYREKAGKTLKELHIKNKENDKK